MDGSGQVTYAERSHQMLAVRSSSAEIYTPLFDLPEIDGALTGRARYGDAQEDAP